MSSFFQYSREVTFVGNPQFQHVNGNVTHIHQCQSGACEGQSANKLMPKQSLFRKFFLGDLILRSEISSVGTSLYVKSINLLGREQIREVEVTKRYQLVEVAQIPYRTFTSVTVEPRDRTDKDIIHLLWEQFYEAYSTNRSPRFTQMLGVVASEIPTFILHAQLTNGKELNWKYGGVVDIYLEYTHKLAIRALRADESLALSVSEDRSDWTFDLNAGSWLYDPASASIEPWQDPSDFSSIPLLQGTRPQLDVEDITAYLKRIFGSLLNWVASMGKTDMNDDPSDYSPHGLLTFGAVVRHLERDVLAHFPSTPPPEWHFESRSRNIKASYSDRVRSRVDFHFSDVHKAKVDLRFSLRLPLKAGHQLRCAYLSQYASLLPNELIQLIDEVGFSLSGRIPHNHPSFPPAYLFVPALSIEHINGMHCVHAPLLNPLFYWTSDPAGKIEILKEDWEQYGLPELKLRTWLGSFWWPWDYELARTHLRKKGYDTDGKRYARDHGYPELIRGDPHVNRMMEVVEPDDDKPPHSGCALTSSSTFSLVDAPTQPEVMHEEKCSISALLVKGFGLWTKKNAIPSEPKRNGESESVNSGSPTVAQDGWDWVDSDDL
ncbi:hypothetical protein PQX77_013409 [Marasmius sp. AFHP31]|nr:hypothetical protein PQX77_013409 [Marasmius sp. AFHP31]